MLRLASWRSDEKISAEPAMRASRPTASISAIWRAISAAGTCTRSVGAAPAAGGRKFSKASSGSLLTIHSTASASPAAWWCGMPPGRISRSPGFHATRSVPHSVVPPPSIT